MKLARTIAVLLLAVSGQAFAADVTPPPPAPSPPPVYKSLPSIYNWSRIYVGINAGYGSGFSNWSNAPLGSTGQFPVYGFLVGGTLGANYQVGDYVFGIEGDGDWANVTGNSGLTCGGMSAVLPTPDSCQTQSRWLATVRGRVGYALDRILFYGTAGAAFGGVQAGLNPPATFDSATEPGWTVGAGVEFGITPNWTAKVEYLYVDLRNAACTTVGSCGAAAGSVVSFNENMVRAGVNFKFGPW